MFLQTDAEVVILKRGEWKGQAMQTKSGVTSTCMGAMAGLESREPAARLTHKDSNQYSATFFFF